MRLVGRGVTKIRPDPFPGHMLYEVTIFCYSTTYFTFGALVYIYFCCVGFSFFIIMLSDWLGGTSLK